MKHNQITLLLIAFTIFKTKHWLYHKNRDCIQKKNIFYSHFHFKVHKINLSSDYSLTKKRNKSGCTEKVTA